MQKKYGAAMAGPSFSKKLLIVDWEPRYGLSSSISNQKSSVSNSSHPARQLRLDRGLIDQHDGDVVLDRIDPVTLLALQGLRALTVFECLFARRTNQNFQ